MLSNSSSSSSTSTLSVKQTSTSIMDESNIIRSYLLPNYESKVTLPKRSTNPEYNEYSEKIDNFCNSLTVDGSCNRIKKLKEYQEWLNAEMLLSAERNNLPIKNRLEWKIVETPITITRDEDEVELVQSNLELNINDVGLDKSTAQNIMGFIPKFVAGLGLEIIHFYAVRNSTYLIKNEIRLFELIDLPRLQAAEETRKCLHGQFFMPLPLVDICTSYITGEKLTPIRP